MGTKHDLDYLGQSEIFSMANGPWIGAGFQFGDVVEIFGAGKPYLILNVAVHKQTQAQLI
jgi:hypothetical protein